MSTPLRTVLIGAGRIGAEYADDPIMARHYPYAAHAQVLAAHPAFLWDAAVDPSERARGHVHQRWGVRELAAAVSELPANYQPAVAVIATPPENRLAVLEQLTSLRAVLVEKPLGTTLALSQRFLELCEKRGILVQVNLTRRADETLRQLAGGGLHEHIGRFQAGFGLYGNGLLNNGIHMVDLTRMLLGEVYSVQTVAGVDPYPSGPISRDVQVPFMLELSDRRVVMMQPLRFEHYRENALDIWGEGGRMAIMQESLTITLYPRVENRAIQGEYEIASDRPSKLPGTMGYALYRMYDNLAAALQAHASLWSPGDSALQTARVVEAVLESAQQNGRPVHVAQTASCRP